MGELLSARGSLSPQDLQGVTCNSGGRPSPPLGAVRCCGHRAVEVAEVAELAEVAEQLRSRLTAETQGRGRAEDGAPALAVTGWSLATATRRHSGKFHRIPLDLLAPPGEAENLSSVPKARSTCSRGRGHRWALTHWEGTGCALSCPPKPWARVPHGGEAEAAGFSSQFNLPAPSKRPPCGRKAPCAGQGLRHPRRPTGAPHGGPLSMRDRPEAISGTEGQFRALGPRGTGPEGLEGHHPPQEKRRPPPGSGRPGNPAGDWRRCTPTQRRRGRRRPLPQTGLPQRPCWRTGRQPSRPCTAFSKTVNLLGGIIRRRRAFLLITLCWTSRGAGTWWQLSPGSTVRREVTAGRWPWRRACRCPRRSPRHCL